MLPSITPLTQQPVNYLTSMSTVINSQLITATNGLDKQFTVNVTSYTTVTLQNGFGVPVALTFFGQGSLGYQLTLISGESVTLHFNSPIDQVQGYMVNPGVVTGTFTISTSSIYVSTDIQSEQASGVVGLGFQYATLPANVSCNVSVFTNLLSLTLGTGVWQIDGMSMLQANSSAAAINIQLALRDTVPKYYGENDFSLPSATATLWIISLMVGAQITVLSGSLTLFLAAMPNTVLATALAIGPPGAIANGPSTWIRAVQVG